MSSHCSFCGLLSFFGSMLMSSSPSSSEKLAPKGNPLTSTNTSSGRAEATAVAAAFAASSGGAAQREPERATLNQFRKTFKLLSSAFTL